MTADPVSDLNNSMTDFKLLKPSDEYIGPPSVTKPPVVRKQSDGLDQSTSTLATTECSESSWMGDSFHNVSTSPSSLKVAPAKKPAMKILPEAPNLDLENSETSGRTFDYDEHEDDQDDGDDDSSMMEILHEYLSQRRNETQNTDDGAIDTAALNEVSVPARRPKLYRTPTPDPDGLYLAIRKAPRRARKKRGNVTVTTEVQSKEDIEPNQTQMTKREDDGLAVPLCRNKSFEDIMGNYVDNAKPKRVPTRRMEETVVDHERGVTVGASRSFDAQDFLQVLSLMTNETTTLTTSSSSHRGDHS